MTDDAVFRALADPSRRLLLDRLYDQGGQTLGALCLDLAMTRQAVAKHLGILEAANLVATRRQGREKLHFLNPVPINEATERWIGKFDQQRLAALSDLKRTLQGDPMPAPTLQSPPKSTFVYVTFIRTTPERLWSALTDPKVMRNYWFGMHQDSAWTPGSPWRMVRETGEVTDAGEILEADAPRRLVIKWRNEFRPELTAEGYSRCTYELEPADGAVKLSVIHEIEVEGAKLIEAVSGGWPRILSNLKSLLETGQTALAA